MDRYVRGLGIVALALAAACSKGAGRAGGVQSVDGVVASVKEHAVAVRTQDGRTLDFPMKEDVKVTLAGGEASAAVVTEGAPVRVAYKERGDAGKELVSIDVEPKGAGRAGSNAGSVGGAGQPPASGRFQAEGGNEGDAHARPPQPGGQRSP